MELSSVPQEWRDANVTPLFKKGSRTKTTNYRPVSLTSQVVKLLERLVYDQVLLTLNQKQNYFLSPTWFPGHVFLCNATTGMYAGLDHKPGPKSPNRYHIP